MTQASKSRGKKRLLLDEEELKPKADAWDIFYGKVPPVSAKSENAVSICVDDIGVDDPELQVPRAADNAVPETETAQANSIDISESRGTGHDLPSGIPAVENISTSDSDTALTLQTIEPISIRSLAFKSRRPERADANAYSVGDVSAETPAKEAHSEAPIHSKPQNFKHLLSFEAWLKHWSPWLKRGGSVTVCQAFYELTHARGSAECFTSNSAIMKLTNLSRAQCIRNIHYLINIGFLEELGESNNKEAKGTHYRFNLVPSSFDLR